MKDYQNPSHARWDCKYHVVFIPKRRKKKIFGAGRHVNFIDDGSGTYRNATLFDGTLMRPYSGGGVLSITRSGTGKLLAAGTPQRSIVSFPGFPKRVAPSCSM